MVASMPIEVVRVHVEGLESAQHHKADAAGRDGAHMHALNVIGTLDAIGDVPTALHRFPQVAHATEEAESVGFAPSSNASLA